MARGVKTDLFWYQVNDPLSDAASLDVFFLIELDTANVDATAAGKVRPVPDNAPGTKVPMGIRSRKNENAYGIQPRQVELQVVGDLTGTQCYLPTKFRKLLYPILNLAQWALISTELKALPKNTAPASYPDALKFKINHSADGSVAVNYVVVGINQQKMSPGLLQ